MSKFNPSIKVSTKFVSEKLAGGAGMKAAKQDNISLLRRVVLANLLWENNAYIDGQATVDQIRDLIPLCNPAEVASLAVEARLLQKLRHTPLFIVVEMCKYKEHSRYVSKILPKIITRADMITDFVALYWKDGKKPLSAQAKKGLAKSFDMFLVSFSIC